MSHESRGPSGIVFINKARQLPEPDWNIVLSTYYTATDVEQHSQLNDAWVSYNGKVYNITQYLQYHPGGQKSFIEYLGKDITQICGQIHGWVNVEQTIKKLCIGILKVENQLKNRFKNAFTQQNDEDL